MPQDAEPAAIPPIDPAALPVVTINFEYGDSSSRDCRKLPEQLYEKFTAPHDKYAGYGALEVNVSVVDLGDDVESAWWDTPDSKWMRQKVRRAEKLGYEFRVFEQAKHIDDIHEINTSLESRQGSPLSQTLRAKPAVEVLPAGECRRHRRDYFGVFKEGRLYAYAYVLQCGEMMLYSRLLGHGDHLDDGIMNLLVYRAAEHRQQESGTRYGVYHLQDNGTEGLQFFKRKMGFRGYRVHWELARPGVAVSTRRPLPGAAAARAAYHSSRNLPVVGAVARLVRKVAG